MEIINGKKENATAINKDKKNCKIQTQWLAIFIFRK